MIAVDYNSSHSDAKFYEEGVMFLFRSRNGRKRHIIRYNQWESFPPYCSLLSSRGVAQPGSAPALGAGGRRFKSSRPDQLKTLCWIFEFSTSASFTQLI